MADEITFKRVDLGDGVIFEGEIQNGQRFVYGKYSFQSITYIGEFDENSDMSGMGKITIEEEGKNMVRIGTFKGQAPNGLPLLNGVGEYYFDGRLRYVGTFVDDQEHGYGTFYYDDGSRYDGKFAHGRMHGKGVLTNVNGTTIEVKYENGKPVNVDGV